MKKIIFNDKYGLTRAVLEGRKTQTRRIAYTGNATNIDCAICVEPKNIGRATLFHGIDEITHSRYCIGEEVAVAQAYICLINDRTYSDNEILEMACSKGWINKRYVKADLMPNRIRITNIRIERLQDISEEDCLAEGIVDFESRINKAHFYSITDESATYGTAKKPYSLLIDKICGKGTWKSNPYVFVYEFELIK